MYREHVKYRCVNLQEMCNCDSVRMHDVEPGQLLLELGHHSNKTKIPFHDTFSKSSNQQTSFS